MRQECILPGSLTSRIIYDVVCFISLCVCVYARVCFWSEGLRFKFLRSVWLNAVQHDLAGELQLLHLISLLLINRWRVLTKNNLASSRAFRNGFILLAFAAEVLSAHICKCCGFSITCYSSCETTIASPACTMITEPRSFWKYFFPFI